LDIPLSASYTQSSDGAENKPKKKTDYKQTGDQNRELEMDEQLLFKTLLNPGD